MKIPPMFLAAIISVGTLASGCTNKRSNIKEHTPIEQKSTSGLKKDSTNKLMIHPDLLQDGTDSLRTCGGRKNGTIRKEESIESEAKRLHISPVFLKDSRASDPFNKEKDINTYGCGGRKDNDLTKLNPQLNRAN